jgi:hypothetical protein
MTIVAAVRINRERMVGIIMTATAIVFYDNVATVTLVTGVRCPAFSGPRWYRM